MAKSPPRVLRRLLIAEKPIQGKAIADALLQREEREERGNCIVGRMHDGAWLCCAWAKGHLLKISDPGEQRPEWRQFRLEDLPLVPDQFNFRYTPREPDLLDRLGVLLDRADEVVNACDAAREGELIFSEILIHLGRDAILDGRSKTDFTRMWIKDTTREGLIRAWADRRSGTLQRYQFLREAAFARAHADWIWGMSLSRYATLALRESQPSRPFSVGRVQTPVLALVEERCREIVEFQSEPFWELEAGFRTSDQRSFRAYVVAPKDLRFGNVDTRFATLEGLLEIKREVLVQAHTAWAVRDEIEVVEQPPPEPFSLVTLQRAAARLWKWSGKKTLDVAQRLYEREHAISYPRTDSSAFPETMQEEILELRQKMWSEWAVREYELSSFGGGGLGEARCDLETGLVVHFDNSKVGDHYGIMPTGAVPARTAGDGTFAPRDEYILWRLITVRFILAWLPNAKIIRAKRLLLRPYRDDQVLRASLECEPVTDPGWLAHEEAMMNTTGIGPPLKKRLAETLLPPCEGGALVDFTRIEVGKTSPPHYFDDDQLLGAMDRFGLGTPATRAEIIEKLQTDQYLTQTSAGSYKVTDDGVLLVTQLKAHGAEELMDVKQTQHWETLLERIEKQVASRPTRVIFLENIRSRVTAIGNRLCAKLAPTLGAEGSPQPTQPAFCPDTGLKIREDERHWIFPAKSRLAEARCVKILAGRPMSAQDYCDILVAGRIGGGPFENFLSRRKTPFRAWLVWKAKEGRFEFVFKTRGFEQNRAPRKA